MFVQTQITPNPNSLKFIPGKKVSLIGPIEITEINKTNNELIRNILSIDGIKSVFLSDDFISINKDDTFDWEDLKHIIISFINDCLASVKLQKYSDIEHIIIDGASTDGTLSILESKRHQFATLISEKDRGIYHAMNIGVRSASGMYIWFLNSGDACNDICFLSSRISPVEAS